MEWSDNEDLLELEGDSVPKRGPAEDPKEVRELTAQKANMREKAIAKEIERLRTTQNFLRSRLKRKSIVFSILIVLLAGITVVLYIYIKMPQTFNEIKIMPDRTISDIIDPIDYPKKEDIRFMIQIGAYHGKVLDIENEVAFTSYDSVSYYNDKNDGLIKYLFGNFSSYEEATKALLRARSQFKDAYIIPFDEEQQRRIEWNACHKVLGLPSHCGPHGYADMPE